MARLQTERGIVGVLQSGSGDATPILFLHGVGSDKSVWVPQVEHFSRSRRAISIDYPGYGESQPAPGATRDDFAEAAIAVLDTLGILSAHVCGLSLGGVVAIAMHAIAPERCASLILADTFAVHPDGEAIFRRSVDASESVGMRALAEARVDVLLGSQAGPGLRAQTVETMAAIDPAAYRQGAEAVWLADQRERVAAIRTPALIVVGTEDRITPPSLSDELAALIPGATEVRILGAGHLANAEQPAAFNAAIDKFLDGVLTTSAW